jgi:predicted permease
MRWVKTLSLRFRSLFQRTAVDHDLDDELRFHLDRQIAANLAAGMPPAEARNAALREFGGVDQVRVECRDVRKVDWLQDLVQDVRYGVRILRKSPSFTIVAVLTLALGIGANTAIFSILESQLWRPLPFPDSERLVDAHTVLRRNPKQWDVLSVKGFRAWRERSQSFSSLAGYGYPNERNFTANGTSERLNVMPVASNFFDTLEVPLAVGRSFLPGEETPGRDRVAILSHTLWQDRFQSDPALLGKPITLDGEAYTVVGVSAPGFHLEYIDEPAIFVPITLDESGPTMRNLYVIGRLASGVTAQRASEELSAILDREQKTEGVKPEDAASVTNLRETWTHGYEHPLYFFAVAVSLVLLIACVNTAGLLLARGLARQREFAVRAALGAGRLRLIRQLLVESLILALAGGAAGALAGVWAGSWYVTFMPEDALPRHASINLDVRVLLFAIGVSIVSALLAGLVPAFLSSRSDLNDALRQNAPGRSASRSQRWARGSLVAIELALGFVLLFGAGLFLSSFMRLGDAPRGFDAPGALTFHLRLRGNRYDDPQQVKIYFDRLTEQLRSQPGVRGVTMGSGLPLTGSENDFANVKISGQPPVGPYGSFVILHAVDPNYPQMLHMRLLAGRNFNLQDTETSPHVTIINRNAAKDLFGAENPVGKVLEFIPDPRRGVAADLPVQVIGVMENTHEYNADEVPFDTLYVPFLQHPVASEYVVVDSAAPRGALAGAIHDAAYALDKDQPIFDMKTMDDRVADSLQGARFNLSLVGALASVALLLVAVGIFGAVAYFVQQRTQEFGIRLALGATPGGILRHAINQSLVIGLAGLAIGIVVALIVGRLLGSALYLVPHEHTGMLYGVKIYDPLTLVSAFAFLTVVLLLASYVPARRAAKVDPVIALRHE